MSKSLTIRSARIKQLGDYRPAVAHALCLAASGMISPMGPPEGYYTDFGIAFKIDGIERRFELDSLTISEAGHVEAICFSAFDEGTDCHKTYIVVLDPTEGGLQQVTIHNTDEDYHPSMREVLAALQ